MNIGDEYVVKIEKFSNLAKGIAKIDGQVIFVDGACVDDVLKIKINKINKNYANAKISEIISPSKHRTKPFCPMYNVCGACSMQNIDYNYQLTLKKQIVEDAMKKIGKIDIPVNFPIASPKTKNFRQKIQYPVTVTKNSKRILAGYFKEKTHDIINIKYCPIQPEICDNIIEYIRNNFPKEYSDILRHIVIRGSEYSNKFLITLVVRQEFSGLKAFTDALFNEFDCIVGVCANINNKNSNVILSDKTICLTGKDFVEEKILDKIFKIGADTFFQINPLSAENIFDYVKKEVKKSENPTVLDMYAGIAVFGIVVSDVSKSVVSVEENEHSIQMAKDVMKTNDVNNIELISADSLEYIKSSNKTFDITILDPPRKGCTEEVLDEVIKHTKEKIIYVSCNPATLARDLKYLQEKGCKVISLQPFDMFCHTYHIETVAIINI